MFRVAVNRALAATPPPETLNHRVVVSWRNVLPVLDRLTNMRRDDEDQFREARLARQREGLLFFVNSYNINLVLIRSQFIGNPLGGLQLGSICATIHESRVQSHSVPKA